MKLKGKCKTCLGCNMLDDFGFKGRKKCDRYIRANEKNWVLLIVAIIELSVIGFGIYGFYVCFNRLVGG